MYLFIDVCIYLFIYLFAYCIYRYISIFINHLINYLQDGICIYLPTYSFSQFFSNSCIFIIAPFHTNYKSCMHQRRIGVCCGCWGGGEGE